MKNKTLNLTWVFVLFVKFANKNYCIHNLLLSSPLLATVSWAVYYNHLQTCAITLEPKSLSAQWLSVSGLGLSCLLTIHVITAGINSWSWRKKKKLYKWWKWVDTCNPSSLCCMPQKAVKRVPSKFQQVYKLIMSDKTSF